MPIIRRIIWHALDGHPALVRSCIGRQPARKAAQNGCRD